MQVGDPFLEKSLVEACLEAFKTGAVVAAQDMGAAGITCSTAEMAAKGGVGIELDLDLIPVRETGMVPYEYLLSESQERMLFVAEAGREQELIDIFERWGLHAVAAGTVIAEPLVRILFQGKTAAEIPATALSDNTPIYHRELMAQPPAYAQTAWAWTEDKLPPCSDRGLGEQTWSDITLALLASPTIASKQWVYRQYDHQVQNNTVIIPGGGDAAIVRLRPLEAIAGPPSTASTLNKGVAATVDCNARYVYLNPYEGAKTAVAEAARNLTCVGAIPLAVTDNLNFGSPENPTGYWQLAEACRGLAEACRAFNTPVTGGNVSLYNETLDSAGQPQPIYPTPVVGMVGLVENLSHICGQGWQAANDVIYRLGIGAGADSRSVTLGGSEYLAVVHHTVAGQPPAIDFEQERAVQAACHYGITQGWIRSAHDCAEGGLAIALAESCISGDRGATIQLPDSTAGAIQGGPRRDRHLFGEGGSRIVGSVAPQHAGAFEAYLSQVNQPFDRLGTVTDTPVLTLSAADQTVLISLELAILRDRWEQAIPAASATSDST